MRTGLARFLADHESDLHASSPDVGAPKPWRAEQRLTDAQISELVARYEAGETTRQLEQAFGLGKTTIVRLLRERGIDIRPRGSRPTQNAATDEPEAD